MTKKLTLREIIDALTHLGTPDAPVELTAGALSFDDITALLRDTISAGSTDYRYWVRDTFPETVVYEDNTTGKLYQADYTLDAATRVVTLAPPVEVIAAHAYEPVAQGAAFAWDGPATFSTDAPGRSQRTGKIFEVGAYPDKNFTLSEAEADAAIAGFAPVPLDIEHVRSIFDGKLGSLTALWRDGANIMGTVDVPDWVDGPWAEQGRKISAAFDRATKMVQRAGLVINPRVADAALMAAFTGARQTKAHTADMQTIHDITTHQGALCPMPATMAATLPEEAPPMTISEALAAWLKAKPAQFTRAEVLAALDDGTVVFAADDPRIVDLTRRVAEGEARERRATASAQVTAALHAGQITPAQVADFTAALAAPVADDPLATFALSDGSQGNHRDAIVAALKKATPNGLTTERVATAAFVLGNDVVPATGSEDALITETRKMTAEYTAGTPHLNKPTNGATNGRH